METITLTITGDVAASVHLLTLIRTDTGATLGLTPDVFVDAGGGVWTHTFTPPEGGLTYAYTYQVYWLDGSASPEESGTHGPVDAAGRYANQDDLEDLRGIENIKIWSNLDNTTTVANVPRIQKALDYADAQIDQRLGNLYTTPMTLAGGDIETVKHWAAALACFWLYQNRGQYDAPEGQAQPSGNQYKAERDEVIAEICQYAGGIWTLGAAKAFTGTPSSLIGLAGTTRANYPPALIY